MRKLKDITSMSTVTLPILSSFSPKKNQFPMILLFWELVPVKGRCLRLSPTVYCGNTKGDQGEGHQGRRTK
jgi:hypothetical protein